MLRAIRCVTLFAVVVLFCSPAEAVLREWDDEGTTSNWSEVANWTDDTVPQPDDETSIGTLADAFDDVVLFDLNGDAVDSLTLVNGADFDTNSGKLVMKANTNIGTGAGSGTTLSELIVRPRNGIAVFAIDTNVLNVGAHGQLTMAGGEVDVDGTGNIIDGVLSIAAGGALTGFGLVDLSDKDASLGEVTSLLVNDGAITVGDSQPVEGEPTAVTLQLTASQAPEFGLVDLGGSSALGTVTVLRNAILKIDTAFLGAETMRMAANARLEMSADGTFGTASVLEINSGVFNPGMPNELPAGPAVLAGEGVFASAGAIRLNQPSEELIIETRIDGVDGVISNRGTVRFRGGGGIRGMALNALDDGSMINESTSLLNFQGGNIYNTPLSNEGLMGILKQDGNATVEFDSFTQTTAGTLLIDLGGILVGEFDMLTVEGDATLAGTLDLDLAAGYIPTLGNTFEILTAPAGVVTGQFDTTDFPVLAGLGFDIVYNAQSVVLQVVESAGGLVGDFDLDGDVDGFDFLKWQRGESPDPLSATDLTDWQTHYGTPGTSAAAATAVPEPTAVVLLGMALVLASRRPVRVDWQE